MVSTPSLFPIPSKLIFVVVGCGRNPASSVAPVKPRRVVFMRISTWKPILILSLGLSLVSIFATGAQAAPPSITSLSTTSGAVGASVTITGSNFGSSQGTSTVKFNGTTATANPWTATSITVTVPSGATTGNVVVNASGVKSRGRNSRVPGAPTIEVRSADRGAVGATVVITGTNFGSSQGTGTVK